MMCSRFIYDKCGQRVDGFDSLQEFSPGIGHILAATALAHDLGNPPFGHAGERAIQFWFQHDRPDLLQDLSPAQRRDFTMFDGNAQTLRLVTRLQSWRGEGGLQLALSTLGTLIKYPWPSDHPTLLQPNAATAKFGYFQSESDVFQLIAQQLGLGASSGGDVKRHPLNFLLEAADDITYLTADLEDAASLGVIRFEEVESLFKSIMIETTPDYYRLEDANTKLAYLRAKAIGKLAQSITHAFQEHYDSIMSGTHSKSLCSTSSFSAEVSEMRHICNERILTIPQKADLEKTGWNSIRQILSFFHGLSEKKKYSESATGTLPLWSLAAPQVITHISKGRTEYERLRRLVFRQ
jgi:dGTPase